jgi:hypothetical protein
VNKENLLYTNYGELFSPNDYEVMSFAGKWMELEIIILSQISQAEKDKYCMWLLDVKKKKDMNINGGPLEG